MTAGRPPKPLEVRLSEGEGNAGYALNGKKYEVEDYDSGPERGTDIVPFSMPVCPSELCERGQAEWDKIWSSGWWLSPEHDFRQVEMIAKAYDLISRFEEQVDVEGDTVQGRFGLEEHPLLKAIDRKNARIEKLLSDLGFSPTARVRLGILVTKAKIGLEKLNQEQKKSEAAANESTEEPPKTTLAWD